VANRTALRAALDSEWGRLFTNWERLMPTAAGWPEVGPTGAGVVRGIGRNLALATRIRGTCIKEAPEVAGLGKSRPGGVSS
jgi:hypothetical protein